MYNLDRFIDAQDPVYSTVLKELQNGRKDSHWMWYIFPQLKELGLSATSKFYGISGIEETRSYLQHPILRERLEECLRVVISCNETKPNKIFGSTDAMKFQSSLTLFSMAEPYNTLFKEALERFFQGITDFETEDLVIKEKRQ